MNRRELAKNGFVGLCGALLGRKVEGPITPDCPDIGFTVRTYTCKAGDGWKVYDDGSCDLMSPDRRSVMMVADGYSLSDGTEIEHG